MKAVPKPVVAREDAPLTVCGDLVDGRRQAVVRTFEQGVTGPKVEQALSAYADAGDRLPQRGQDHADALQGANVRLAGLRR